jgi:hypothetical protein
VLRNNNLFGKRVISSHDKNALKNKDQHPSENSPDAHEEYYVGDMVCEPDYPTTNGKKGVVKDGSTLAHKWYVVSRLINQYEFEHVEIWDDRKEHIETFKILGKKLLASGRIKSFIIHQVYPPKHDGQPAFINTFDIKLGTKR